MRLAGIDIRINKATSAEIREHLISCSRRFIPPLEKRVDIAAYAEKIRSRAVTFEAFAGGELEGLVAAYLNDDTTVEGFITNVSVTDKFTGRGIAEELLNECIEYARLMKKERLSLEVSGDNALALKLYERLGFSTAGRSLGQVKMTLTI